MNFSLSRPGPWNKKFERLIFPAKYVIPQKVESLAIGQVDVSKNSGTPKWMVYNGKPY